MTPELIGGPYAPPPYEVGSALRCAIRGPLTVAGTTAAPIAWPYASGPGGKRLLPICGGLERAIDRESRAAIAHHWGVDPSVVSGWRRALEVPRGTEGTIAAMRAAGKKLTPAARKLAGVAAGAARRGGTLVVLEGRAGGPYRGRAVDAEALAGLGWAEGHPVAADDLPRLVRAALRSGVQVAFRTPLRD